jgi:hypothetical protein
MKRSELVQKLMNEGLSEKALVNLTDNQLNQLAERMLGEGTVMISKGSPTFNADVEAAKKAKKTIETYEEHGVGSKVTKGHNGIPEFMDSKKLKQGDIDESKKKPSIYDKALKKLGGEEGVIKFLEKGMKGDKKKNSKKEKSETKEWVENLAEEKFFHILTSKNEIMEMIATKIKSHVVNEELSPLPDFLKWNSLKAAAGKTKKAEVQENGTKTAPVKPKVDPDTKPKHPLSPGKFPKQKPKADRDPETGKIADKPINPFGEPYKVDKGRKFNEPEEPKTNPKKKEEEKKKKDHPVPQSEVNENGTKTAPVKPKVDPGTKPKHPLNPGKFPKQKPKALAEKKKD